MDHGQTVRQRQNTPPPYCPGDFYGVPKLRLFHSQNLPQPEGRVMAYKLGPQSRAELAGVHPKLVAVVQRAIEISPQDFSVHDGLRTEAEQTALVRKGASQTMNSMHRKQPTGYGHAVDLVPYINGKMRWEWPPIYTIAAAVKFAAAELNVRIRWGGCWEEMSQIKGSTADDMEKAVEAYGAARRRAGKKVFTDGPHYEILP